MVFLVSFGGSDTESSLLPDNSSQSDRPTTLRDNTAQYTAQSDSRKVTANNQTHTLPIHARPDLKTTTSSSFNMVSPADPTTPPATPKAHATATSSRSREAPGRRSIDSVISDRSLDTMAVKEFPYDATDYSILPEKKLGEGLWSLVYQARPAPAEVEPPLRHGSHTPPLSPITGSSEASPSSYAIKFPSSKSARNVLTHEARILSTLTATPGSSAHIVPFYGQDGRTGSLVLGFFPNTLETFTDNTLNTLSEADRASKLANIFPTLALQLVEGMQLMHSANVVHADLKPSNILLDISAGTHSRPTAVYADFSSSLLLTDPSAPPSLGGGTWDFLSPAILRNRDATPSPRTDVHALGISLLCLIFGQSPFEAVQHVHMRREMIKQGQALEAAYYLLQNFRRMQALTTALGFDVEAWVRRALGDGPVELRAWGAELKAACQL